MGMPESLLAPFAPRQNLSQPWHTPTPSTSFAISTQRLAERCGLFSQEGSTTQKREWWFSMNTVQSTKWWYCSTTGMKWSSQKDLTFRTIPHSLSIKYSHINWSIWHSHASPTNSSKTKITPSLRFSSSMTQDTSSTSTYTKYFPPNLEAQKRKRLSFDLLLANHTNLKLILFQSKRRPLTHKVNGS